MNETCAALGCVSGHLVCHRCGQSTDDVRQRFVTQRSFSLAGSWPKVSVRATHGCDSCWAEFATDR